MEIHFRNVQPFPIEIANKNPQSNCIWNNSVDFISGQHYKIIAPSGTGKSTLTHILAGIRQDYHGEISIKNQTLKSYDNQAWENLRNSQMAFVFQSLKLFPQLTAEENILLKAEWCPNFQISKIRESAEILGVSPFLKTPISKLSFGQCQRIAIIRAICQPFQWIILDEPFSHLDAENRDLAWALITKSANANNAGIILCLLDDLDAIKCHQTLYVSNHSNL